MSHVVRASWLGRVVLVLQRSVGRITSCPIDDVPVALRRVARDMPPPKNHAEWMQLYGALVQFATQAGATLHARDRDRSIRCAAVESQLVARLCGSRPHQIRVEFERWADAFGQHLVEAHQPSLASRIADGIWASYDRPLDVGALSKHYGVTTAQLRRRFAQAFGISLRDYRERVRIIKALGQVQHAKIEAIAHAVGYRSRKNFYRAFLEHVGTTPAQCRKLDPESFARLEDGLKHGLERERRVKGSERRVGERRRNGAPLPTFLEAGASP